MIRRAAGFLVILPIEGLVVGAFARRGKSPLLAGTLVWVTVALSLVIAPRLFGVGYLRQTIWPIAMQVALSGLVALVVADLLAVGLSTQEMIAGDRPPNACACARTRSMRSSWSRRCRCCCWPRWTVS